MTLHSEVVRERLRKLREVVQNLGALQAIPLDQFVSSFRHYWLAERGLQLAAEVVFDIGNHILAGTFNVHPQDYEDVTRCLADRGVISAALRDRLKGLGRFRNILVHGYIDIDERRVHEHLLDRLSDFDRFADEVEAFLDRQIPPPETR